MTIRYKVWTILIHGTNISWGGVLILARIENFGRLQKELSGVGQTRGFTWAAIDLMPTQHLHFVSMYNYFSHM